MPNVFGHQLTLWKAAARSRDRLFVAATMDQLVQQEVSHSYFLGLNSGQWAGAGETNWSTVAVCVARSPTERLVAISEDGDVHTYVNGATTSEAIQPAPRALRGLAEIDGLAYACGMLREVYVRTGEARWQSISAPSGPTDTPAGFEAIAGYGENDIYAVGWSGEIWHRAGQIWTQRHSPVNIILTGVCCAANGFVYACGQNGTILKGRDDRWVVLEHDFPVVDLWDIHAFGDAVFVASFSRLLQIENDIVGLVNFGEDSPSTCHRLTSADGMLWSVGAEDVFSFDGTAWQRVV
jgi:hypothetical protein